ncbi:MAG: hypothetical protein AB8C13_10180 [Phycisphaerales bacterium]
MGLTTERKVFLGLMVVAGASLVIDQAILSPGSASAAPLNTVQVNSLPDEQLLSSTLQPVTNTVTKILNDRLAQSEMKTEDPLQSDAISRMFSPLIKPKPVIQPAQQSSIVDATPLASIASQDGPQTPRIQQLPTNLPSLTGVMPSRSGASGAILNGTMIQTGDSTPTGYRLLKVEQRQVLVEYNDAQIWLKLPSFQD